MVIVIPSTTVSNGTQVSVTEKHMAMPVPGGCRTPSALGKVEAHSSTKVHSAPCLCPGHTCFEHGDRD